MDNGTIEIIIAIGLVTYLVRLAPFLVIRAIRLPESVIKWIHYLGEGIIVSLLIPFLLLEGDKVNISLGNIKIISSLFCILVALLTKSMICTILIGIVITIVLHSFVK